LVGKPERRRQLGRPTRRWVYNIKMDLTEIWWDGIDWIDLAQDRDQWRTLVNTIMKFLSSCTISSFLRRAQLREWVSWWQNSCDSSVLYMQTWQLKRILRLNTISTFKLKFEKFYFPGYNAV
jgi:hypothetical protein